MKASWLMEFPSSAFCWKGKGFFRVCAMGIAFMLIEQDRVHGQVACRVFCEGTLAGTGTRNTPEECLTDFCRHPVSCGCRSLTDCTADGVSVMPASVCGDGRHEGTEECDPGVDPTGFGENDCDCPDQCEADCTCPTPVACEVFCEGSLAGTGTRDTAEECLTDFCRHPVSCGCRSLTDCTADGVSVMPASVCGDGRHEGTEECDPGVDPTGFGENDCDCPDQCQTNCTCPEPGSVCGDNLRWGGEECDGSDATACPGLCQADCLCPGRSNRYLALRRPIGPDQPVFVRITLTSLDRFPSFNGQNRYLGGALVNAPNEGGSPSSFMSTNLTCTPLGMSLNWSQLFGIFIRGPEIVPNSTYTVRILRIPDLVVLHQYTLMTGKWGDIVVPFGTNQPDFSDISAMVDKFKVAPGAPPKTRTQLQPNDPLPWMPISFADISQCVDAFKGVSYPFVGPTACP